LHAQSSRKVLGFTIRKEKEKTENKNKKKKTENDHLKYLK
jgi:hypothetical protein